MGLFSSLKHTFHHMTSHFPIHIPNPFEIIPSPTDVLNLATSVPEEIVQSGGGVVEALNPFSHITDMFSGITDPIKSAMGGISTPIIIGAGAIGIILYMRSK